MKSSLKAAGQSAYHQLYLLLRQQLKDGAYAYPTPLPSELSLCQTHDVSRVTVRRALKMLEDDGLILRRHGIGTFAASADNAPASPAPPLVGVVENLITLGLETTTNLVAIDNKAELPRNISDALKVVPGTKGVRLERVRYFKDEPFSHSVLYLPPTFAKKITANKLENQPIIRLLESFGAVPADAEQAISAGVADKYLAAHLSMPVGAPLIRLRRIVHDMNGEVLVYQFSNYNPDKYEYHMTLSRDNGSNRPRWRHIG